MSSTMETHLLDTGMADPPKPMDWKELAVHQFQVYAAGCRFKTAQGLCRPGACRCEMANCEYVRRWGS